MYEGMKDLVELDWGSFLLSLTIVLVAIYSIKMGIEKFCDAFNLETPWMKRKRERDEFNENIKDLYSQLEVREKNLEHRHADDIEQLKELNSSVCNAILELKEEFTIFREKSEKNELKKNIKKIRWDIIDFASSIADKKNIPLEQYNIIFSYIREYEELVETYNLKNGQVQSSVDVIRDRYEQDLRSGLLKIK